MEKKTRITNNELEKFSLNFLSANLTNMSKFQRAFIAFSPVTQQEYWHKVQFKAICAWCEAGLGAKDEQEFDFRQSSSRKLTHLPCHARLNDTARKGRGAWVIRRVFLCQ